MSVKTLLQRIEEIGRRPLYLRRELPESVPYGVSSVKTFLGLGRVAVMGGGSPSEAELIQIRNRWEPEILDIAEDGYLFAARELAIKYSGLLSSFQRAVKKSG